MTNKELIELENLEKVGFCFQYQDEHYTIRNDEFEIATRLEFLRGKKEESDFRELKMTSPYIYNPENCKKKVINPETENEEIKESRCDNKIMQVPSPDWKKLIRSPESKWIDGHEYFLTPEGFIFGVDPAFNIGTRCPIEMEFKIGTSVFYRIKDIDGKIKGLALEKETKTEPETFDFYEAMRRLYNGKRIGTNILIDYNTEIGAVTQVLRYEYWLNDEGFVTSNFDKNPGCFKKSAIYSVWFEIKEQPKTFGWDEAYRFIRIGKAVAKLSWEDKTAHIFWTLGMDNFTRKAKIGDKWIEHDCAISAKAMKATDWYVYEE